MPSTPANLYLRNIIKFSGSDGNYYIFILSQVEGAHVIGLFFLPNIGT